MKIVHYRNPVGDIVVGQSAFVFPIDHTSSLVSNTTMVRTSAVKEYDPKSGVFVTQNNVYVPE